MQHGQAQMAHLGQANFLHCAGWGPMSNTTLEQSVQVALSCTETLEAGYTDPKSRKYYCIDYEAPKKS